MGLAAVVGGGIAAAGAIGGALINSGATSSAAKTEATSAANSTAVQQQEFGQTQANNAPFLATGTGALDQLATLYNLPGGSGASTDPNASFYQSPDYNFDLSQGIKGVDAGAAARGMLDSGATRKAEISYAGNLASGQFNSYATRLQGLAGIGQSAANMQSNAGQANANAITGINTAAADNTANLTLSSGNSTANALNSIAGQVQQTLGKNPFGSSYTAPSTPTSSTANTYLNSDGSSFQGSF